jgi:hypothetical protein
MTKLRALLPRLLLGLPLVAVAAWLALGRDRLDPVLIETAIRDLGLALTWVGHAGRETAAGNDTAIRYGLMGLALLPVIAFVPRLWRRLTGGAAQLRWIEVGELVRRLAGHEAIAVIDVRGPDEFAGPLGHVAKRAQRAAARPCAPRGAAAVADRDARRPRMPD